MKFYLRRFSVLLIAAPLFLSSLSAGEISDPLLKKLVEKGIISNEDAADILASEKGEKEPTKKSKIGYLKDYPEFVLGREEGRGVEISNAKSTHKIKVGVRFQTVAEDKTTYSEGENTTRLQDAYLRRTRLEVKGKITDKISFSMDLRNDKVNKGDSGEGTFNTGSAILFIKKPFESLGSLVNFKFNRSKLDVSRSSTVSSARTINFLRSHTSVYAQDYVSHNRFTVNAQVYGHYKKKFHYSFAFGEGVHSSKMQDAKGNKDVAVVNSQSFVTGGKIILSPFSGWEETGKKRETFFGQGKHFSIGYAFWKLNDLNYTTKTTETTYQQQRSLTNIELSMHYESFSFQTEYFEFDGQIENFKSVSALNEGKSKGYYVLSEYNIKDSYVAPFVRFESWDKFVGKEGYDLKSNVYGVNWYLQGNRIKVGLSHQEDKIGDSISGKKDKVVTYTRLTSQFHF